MGSARIISLRRTCHRCDRSWQFQRCDDRERGHKLDVLPPRREIHSAHRWVRRCAARLRNRIQVRSCTAPVLSHGDAGRAPAGARDRVGQPITAMRRWSFSQPGSQASRVRFVRLHRHRSDLELQVRELSLHQRPARATITKAGSMQRRTPRSSDAKVATDPVPITLRGPRQLGHWSKLGALQDPVRAVGKRRRCSLVHRRISVQATWPALFWVGDRRIHCRARIECGSPRALLSPGALFARLGNLDHAEAELKSALAPDPSFAPAAVRIRLLPARPPYRSQ